MTPKTSAILIPKSKQAPAPIAKWGDLFQNPDTVGSSEYRSLSELCANAIDIENIGGEVDSGNALEPEDIDHIEAVLEETISHANELLAVIRQRKCGE